MTRFSVQAGLAGCRWLAILTPPSSPGTAAKARFHRFTPPLTLMISTKIEWSFNKIARLKDPADLAEMLFPGNRNQQHAFLAVWLAIKWSDHRMVPNLEAVARQNGISKRTAQRVRAKMRRIGLIDHVSRFNANYCGCEGWVLSRRFERSLQALADSLAGLKETADGSRDKDAVLLEFADARRRATRRTATDQINTGGDADV